MILTDIDITPVDSTTCPDYTDDKGAETYNLNLSQQRAQEVARLLSRQFDLAPP
ncbi:MAG TPA: hypothetical protein VGS79_23830 [Puia sp.]|nr:hypothetical protein [Puia sp.]